ncbi:hypothetical protein [Natronorubrum halophilum]|uniref:hypothetical protein n=1 Tax=Natronorubrum halophilum TaxID=1702106 RepID=UPI000EF6D4EC|nr:hypothetical protein [Natronorubrum halophilum]
MRALSIELEDDLVDALEAERELFGFESRQAYVRWIIANRGSIEAEQRADHGGERDRSMADYDARLAHLEERVASLMETIDRNDESDSRADGPERATDAARTTDESVLEVRGSPRTVRQSPDSSGQSAEEAADSGPADRTREESEPEGAAEANSSSGGRSVDSSTLTPERVARIPEDPVLEDAGVLGSVETERLDELSRRAVASTRKRLDRDVQTGLEYASSTRLASSDVRPGEDITDLDALSVPGRSSETLEKRRRAVGRALAYVRDEGSARRSDFVEALYAECPADYETADGWWRCIKEGLKQVNVVDGGDGARAWRYRG